MTKPNKTRFGSILIAITICFGQLSYSHAGTIFSENFEVTNGDVRQGNAPYNDLVARGWGVSPNCNGYCSMSIVPAPSGRTGSVLRFTYAETVLSPPAPSDDSHNAFLERNWPGVPEMYERYYVRFETVNPSLPSPMTGGAGYKQHYINQGVLPNFGSMMTDGGYYRMGNQTTITHICPPGASGWPDGDVTCNLNQNVGSVSIPHGVWACIETHIGQSSVDLWINGTQVVHYTSGVYYPSDYNRVVVYRQGSNNEYRYEDDYVVSTSRIGCSGSSTTSTQTSPQLQAPSSPTNLQVN